MSDTRKCAWVIIETDFEYNYNYAAKFFITYATLDSSA